MRSEFWRFAVTAAAAVLVIAALSYYQFLVRVDTSVFFDVNPSFTLSVNRLNRVVFVDSDNDDAKAVLAGEDLKGEKLEDAVETLFDVMKEQGYFEEEEKTVLVSVDCNSRERLAKITEDLTEEINEYLTQNTGGGSVFGQTVHVDEETRKFARSHRISPGKAALVLKIAEEHPEQDTEKMASLTMNELVSYLHSQNIDLRDSLDYRGLDPEQPQGEGSQNEEGDAIQGAGNGSTQMTKENPGLLSPGQETPSEQ